MPGVFIVVVTRVQRLDKYIALDVAEHIVSVGLLSAMKKSDSSEWMHVELRGALSIEKLVSEFMLRDQRIPSGRTKIRVWQDRAGRFSAHVDTAPLEHNGSSTRTAGSGSSEFEALEQAIAYFMADLEVAAKRCDRLLIETNFEDADPHDF
jgi:hypothetical protein